MFSANEIRSLPVYWRSYRISIFKWYDYLHMQLCRYIFVSLLNEGQLLKERIFAPVGANSFLSE